MTRDDLLNIRDALDKASYWARKQADLFQIIDAKKKVEASLNEHSLPFNLDDAAHSYSESDEPLYSPGHRFHWDNESLFGKQIETTFKAGAEWMAKQGVSYQATISADNTIPVLPMKDVSDMGFDYGDKVRIIIVKEK